MVVAVSLFATPNNPRQRRVGGSAQPYQAPESASAMTPPAAEGKATPRWTPPAPDPRCFLFKTISEFYGQTKPAPVGDYSHADELKGCRPGKAWGVPSEEASHVRFVIATVPDPVHTHLSLFFDRSIDAIQEAAQEDGWAFGLGSMPWESSEHAESPDLDMRIAQQAYQKQKESLPGVMIFRRFRRPDLGLGGCAGDQRHDDCGKPGDTGDNDKDVLFIFVVGETPTGGIHKTHMLSLLTRMRVPAKKQSSHTGEEADLEPADYTEYGSPAVGRKPQKLRPAAWLTVLGRDAYWPMALLDDYTVPCCDIPTRLSVIRGEARAPTFNPSRPKSWTFTCGLACALILIFAVYTRLGSLFATSEALVSFAPVQDWRRSYILLLGVLLLAMMILLLGWPALRWYSHLSWRWWFWGMFGFLIFLVVNSAHDLHRRGSIRWPIALLLALAATGFVALRLYYRGFDLHGNEAILRYVHLSSGVSPLPACLMLIAAGLWWAWYSLQGLMFIDRRRPLLPSRCDLELPFSITNEGNRSLIAALQPVTSDLRVYLPAITVLMFTLAIVNFGHPVQTLEGRAFDRLYAAALLGVTLVLLTTLSQLFVAWLECRRLLLGLDRLPLRRGFKRVSGFSWKSIWSLGGGSWQESNRAISHEMETFTHLTHTNPPIAGVDEHMFDDVRREISEKLNEIFADKSGCHKKFDQEKKRRSAEFNDGLITVLEELQMKMATLCVAVFRSLQLAWSLEHGFLLFESQDCERTKEVPRKSEIPEETQIREHFVCLVYVNVITVVLSRMRTLIVITAGMYVFLLLAVTVYPVEPKLTLRPLLIGLLFFLVAIVAMVYAQMHRDATLSLLTDTKPGELGGDFWIRIMSFAALPLLSLVVAQFPDVYNFLFSWLPPAMQAFNR